MLGWIGNALIIASWYWMADKNRHAILLGVGGSFLWAIVGLRQGMFDLVFIEVVLAGLAIRVWLSWRS